MKYCTECGKKLIHNNVTGICIKCRNTYKKCIDCGKTLCFQNKKGRCSSCNMKHDFKVNGVGRHFIERIEKVCLVCGTIFKVRPCEDFRKLCSVECIGKYHEILHEGAHDECYNEFQCDYCGDKVVKLISNTIRNEHIFCSRKCRHNWLSENCTGKNSFHWTGGCKHYYGPNWRIQRRLTIERDENTCQLCGITSEEFGKTMHVHHMIPFRIFNYIVDENDNYIDANDLNNLECLCSKCHGKTEGEFFKQEKLIRGFL